MTMRFRNPSGSEDGFTLIELMVASLLGVLVLSVVGGIMWSSSQAEGLVRNVTSATSAGQAVANSLENGIRNSENSFGQVIPLKILTSGSDQMVVALVAQNGATASAKCQAWYYDATNKLIRYTTSASAIALPSSATLAAWTKLSTGVKPITGSTIVFSLRGTTGLNFAFQEDAGKDPAVAFQSSITSRTGLTGSVACF
jgi:prepilin-type N-terminal cleavage/methylation domain-containing protein